MRPPARPTPPVAAACSAGRQPCHNEPLAAHDPRSHPAGMFVVTEAEAAAIRAVYEHRSVRRGKRTNKQLPATYR